MNVSQEEEEGNYKTHHGTESRHTLSDNFINS